MYFVRKHKWIFRVCFLLLTILYMPYVNAKVEILDGSIGLSSNAVTSIIKDRGGLMWMGTQNGLNSYDGYVFSRPYPELSNQPITHLAYNSDKNLIWVGTSSGLYCVERDNGSVHFVGNADWSNSVVSALLAIPGGNVYVAYESGIIAIVEKNFSLRQIRSSAVEDQYIRKLQYHSGSARIFFSYNDHSGLYCMNLLGGDIRQIHDTKVGGYLAVSLMSDTLLFQTTSSGIKVFDSTYHQIVVPALSKAKRVEASVLYDGCLFVALSGNYYVEDTLIEINLKDGSVTDLGKDANVFIGRQKYYCAFRDEQEILWIGTNRGIFKIIPERKLFEKLLHNAHVRFPARTIIEEPNGDIYAGSHYGLYLQSAQTGACTLYEYEIPQIKQVARINAMVSDRDYIYSTGSGHSFLSRFNKRSKKFETYFYPKVDMSKVDGGFSIMKDAEGIIWIGSNGLFTYDPNSNIMARHQNDIFDIGNCHVQGLKEGRDKSIIWVATNRGLYKVHKVKGVLAYFHRNSVPALSANDIYFAEEDSSGYLWLGTNGGGVNIISPDYRSIQYLNKEHNGLSNDIVYGMLRDERDRLWISTFNGLSCYDTRKGTFFNYYKIDGLCEDEFNYNSFLRARNGKMYFGGINGISAFFPDKMKMGNNSRISLHVLPAIKWNARTKTFSTNYDFKGNGNKIVLNSPNSLLMFNLVLTDYTDPVHNNFTYRIVGLSDEWVSLSGQPVLRLNSIPYGYYTIEIKARNARGLAANNMLRFFLHVKKPFYSTGWFYAIILVLAVAIILAFVIIKYKNLQKIQKMRLRIASNLHDEVGSLLTSIIMYSDNVRFGGSASAEKDGRLVKIAELSREATHTMSDILWAVDVRNNVPNSLSERMREYVEELFIPMNVAVSVDISDVDTRQKITDELRQELYLIFKEAVNNILKHSDATRVAFSLRYSGVHKFQFRICNDGLREKPLGTQGQGLKNMHMRAKNVGAEMSFLHENGEFIITVERR